MDKQTKRDYLYMRMARTWAENSYCRRRQVGAILVKDQMIISDGYNGTPAVSRIYVKMMMECPNPMSYTQKLMLLQKLHVAIIVVMVQHYMSLQHLVWNALN